MGRSELVFRRRDGDGAPVRPPEVRARVGAMAALLLLAVALTAARAWFLDQPVPTDVIVEVVGDVPQPGLVALRAPARVHDALRAAGADPTGAVDAALEAGTRLRVVGSSVALERMDDLLVVGLPLDVNHAPARTLEAIPGIGPSRAAAIVAERDANGPFSDVGALQRVRGIGAKTVESLRPFLVASDP